MVQHEVLSEFPESCWANLWSFLDIKLKNTLLYHGGINMLENVEIVEKSTGHIIAEYPVIRELLNEVSKEEYCLEAWENAIDEGLVDANNRNNYEIEIVKNTIQE